MVIAFLSKANIIWSILHEASFIFWKAITINNLVREKRKDAGLTQRELAEKVDVTERTIISIERGKYKPSIVLAYKLAQVFNISIEKLFCLKEYVENEKIEK